MAESGSDNSFHLTSLIKSPFLLVQSLCRPERVGIKFQTFLIHERYGWPRRTGSGTRFTRQMQTNVKPITLITNADRIIHLKMSFKHLREALFFFTKKTSFQTKNFFFCMTNTLRRTQNLNLWFQPENSRFEVRDCNSRTSCHAQWLSCCKNTAGWRPWYRERLALKFPSIRFPMTQILKTKHIFSEKSDGFR